MAGIQENQRNRQTGSNLRINVLQETARYFPKDDIFYPDEDGEPMAASDFQRKPLTYCVDALDAHYETDSDVYVSGDLLIYYEKDNPDVSVAPDVFVVFGVPKYERRIYRIWEEGKSPDVVIEIASKNTWKKDIENIELYRSLGVREYFMFDPTGDYFDPVLQGYRLDKKGLYKRIRFRKLPGGIRKLDSKLLGLELRLESGRLRVYDPKKQEYLLTYSEERAGRIRERTDRLLAEEQVRKNTAENLLAMGVLTVEQIAKATGLSEQEIQELQERQVK